MKEEDGDGLTGNPGQSREKRQVSFRLYVLVTDKRLTKRMLMRKSALQPRSRNTPTGGRITAKLERKADLSNGEFFTRWKKCLRRT